MVDVLTPAQRRYCMSRIRAKDTKPETKLRKALWCDALRYRVKNKLPGRPDIVFSRCKTVVFVDGCFWHMCPKHFSMPKKNRAFWKAKLKANADRDREIGKQLRKQGWRVMRFWEHEVVRNLDDCLTRIRSAVR